MLGIVLACASCMPCSPAATPGAGETAPVQTPACDEALGEATTLIAQTLAALEDVHNTDSADRAAVALHAFHFRMPALKNRIARFLPPGNAAQTEVFLHPPTPAWERYNAAWQRACRALMHHAELFKREDYYGSEALREAMEPLFRPLLRRADGSYDGNALLGGGSTPAAAPPSNPHPARRTEMTRVILPRPVRRPRGATVRQCRRQSGRGCTCRRRTAQTGCTKRC